jgi:photosystem II stability/assembly factor-like uncharacterized protein
LPPDSLYKTTDGGNNWYAMALPNSLTYYDWPIDFSIIGEVKIWFCTSYGKILCTTDGGLNWQLQFYDTTMAKYMNYIEMFDSLNGMAMGDAPAYNKPALFLKTTNGGVDWISQNDNSLLGMYLINSWSGVDFVDMNVGYIGGHLPNQYGHKFYKTINGGKDWELIGDTIACGVIKAYDENILLSEAGTTVSGFLDRTFDGGQTWERGRWDFMQWGNDIEYIPNKPSDVWLVSKSICFSNDTGRTWTAEFENEDIMFEDIIFIDENYGWLFAANRSINQEFFIYRTTNGGHGGIVSVNEIKSNFKISKFILEQNYPNPFNPLTTIKYQIPQLSFVTLKVYDILGNRVITLVNEELSTGEYEVKFSVTQISNLSSGIYFYQLRADKFIQTRKMVLIK